MATPFRTHYHALSLPDPPDSDDLTQVSIKQAYHVALRFHHPDRGLRQKVVHDEVKTEFSPSEIINAIVLAYSVLSSPVKRKEYDESLTHRVRSFVAATAAENAEVVDLDDLECHELCIAHNCIDSWSPNMPISNLCTPGNIACVFSDIWVKSCRCGNSTGFILTEALLELTVQSQDNSLNHASELLVQCTGCSSWIKVLFDVAE